METVSRRITSTNLATCTRRHVGRPAGVRMPRPSKARAIPPNVATPARWILAMALRIAALASLRLADLAARAAAMV